jgi:hypothetical protein
VAKKTKRVTPRIPRTRVGRQTKFIARVTKRSHRRSRKIRRKLRRHEWGLIASLVGLVTSVFLMIFVGVGSVVTIVTGIVSIFGGVASFVVGESTDRNKIHVRRNKGTTRSSSGAVVTHRFGPIEKIKAHIRGGSSGDRVRIGPGKACSALCQWSKKGVDTCECSCGGRMHGIKIRSGASAGTPGMTRPKSPLPSNTGGTTAQPASKGSSGTTRRTTPVARRRVAAPRRPRVAGINRTTGKRRGA